MSKKFVNLKRLKMSNTQALEHLRANPGIESVVLENSKILSISTFVKRVPTPLLSRNNMADYTQIKLNGTMLNESELSKIKLGKMNVEHNDVIEVVDGVLAGTIFTIKLGLPLNSMIKDPVLQEHIRILLGKESVSSDVSKYELDTITWIGKDPTQITENSYLGFFNSKTIGNFETFKKDLEWLPNLRYVNLSGSIFADSVSLSDFPKIENFSYAFADCIVLQSVMVDKDITSFEGAFRNCSNLRTVTIKNVSIANANKSFHNCKGIRNLVVENPNMVDSRDFNTFNEALISETTFSGEPADNTITSKILLDAISSTITLDLTGKKRPDLYNLTSSPNNLMEKIILNNTNIISLDLTSQNMNFLNLRQILADNTEDARTLKLVGDNIQVLSLENSSILYLQIASHETPAVFIDNSNYYNRVEINSVELEPLQVIELKKGNWTFNNADMVTILDGPLANKIFEVSDGIIPTRISKMFPDEVLAEYIRIKTNKDTINDKIRQFEIDAIEYFGSNSVVTSLSTISWFNEKTVDDWTGTNQLRNLKNFFIKGVNGAFTSITINSSKITSLFGAFEGSTSLVDINLVGGLGSLLDASYAFKNCTSIINTDFIGNTMNNVTSLKETFNGCSSLVSANISSSTLISSLESTFEGCSSLTNVILPTNLDLLVNMDNAFKDNTLLTSIVSPSIMNALTSMISSFEGCSSLRTINNFISLNALRSINRTFYGCGELSSIVLPKNLSTVLTAVDTFNSCVKLTSLELNDLSGITDITGIINNTPLLRTIYLDPLLTNCATPLELTGLDLPGKSIIYIKNDDIIYYSQIKYHDENAYSEYQNATLDYSRLTNIRPLIRKIFPCPNVAQYIALQLNKTVNSGILIDELHTIEWFGFVGTNPTTMSSWFSGKNINSFEGMQHLINLRGICLSQATSTPSTIDLSNYNKLESLQCAFNYCRNLTQITLPTQLNNLRTMSEAFQGCSSLTSIVLPNELPNLTIMPSCFKACAKITSITLPQSMPKLENMEMAFYDCATLKTIAFPQSMLKLKSIKTAFRGCRELVDLTMPTETPLLEEMTMAFSSCFLLTSLKLPTSLPKLKNLENAFNGCMDLNLIEMPAMLPLLTTTLANSTLDKEGRTIYYFRDDTVTAKSQIAFHNAEGTLFRSSQLDYSRLTELCLQIKEYFPDSLIAAHIATKLNKTVDDVTDKRELATITSFGGSDYFKDMVINSFEGINMLTGLNSFDISWSIPYDYTKTLVLDLSNSTEITTLEKAFYNCRVVEEVILPETMNRLTSMKDLTYGASYLRKITFPKRAPLLTSLFSSITYCGIEEIVMPEYCPNLKEMPYAFRNNSELKSLTLPLTMDKVERFDNAIQNCPKLTTIKNLDVSKNSLKDISSIFKTSNSLIPSECLGYESILSNSGRTPIFYARNVFEGSSLPGETLTANAVGTVRAESMLERNNSVKHVTLSGEFMLIKNTFKDCKSLETVTFREMVSNAYQSSNLTAIFSGCLKLQSVTFDPNVIISGDISDMFFICESLTTLNLSTFKGITNANDTFFRCSNLNTIYINPTMFSDDSADIFKFSQLDKAGRTIVYLPDDNITLKSQINFHDQNGVPLFQQCTLDYSNLNLYGENSFYSFFQNLELAEHVSGLFGLTPGDTLDDGTKDIITEIGGPLSMPSKLKGDITNWSFVEKLNNLQFINLSSNTVVKKVDLSKAKCLLEVKNAFRGCTSLTDLKLPIDCSNITNFSNVVSNTSQDLMVYLPAKIQSSTTPIENTGFDRNGIIMTYYADDSVTSISQITYYPTVAKAECSNLVNCVDAPILLLFEEYITTTLKVKDSDLKDKYLKDPGFFYNKQINHNDILQAYIEVTEKDIDFNGYNIEILASSSTENNYDYLYIFATKQPINSSQFTPSSSDVDICKITGTFSERTFNATIPDNTYKYIYLVYRKDGSGTQGEDRAKIHSIRITKVNNQLLSNVTKSELNYVTDNPVAIPLSLKHDETMSSIAINGKTMHPSVTEQIKSGEFRMPSYGEYCFKPLDGKYEGITFTCNYKENIFENDVIEAEIVK